MDASNRCRRVCPSRTSVAVSLVCLVVLVAAGALRAQGGPEKKPIADKSYTEAMQFLTDGGSYALRKAVITSVTGKESEWHLVVIGPRDLSTRVTKEVRLGATFGRKVTVAELLGKEEGMSEHARGGVAIENFRTASAEAWNRFVDEVSRAMGKGTCQALLVSVRPGDTNAPLAVLKVQPMTAAQFVKQTREPAR